MHLYQYLRYIGKVSYPALFAAMTRQVVAAIFVRLRDVQQRQ